MENLHRELTERIIAAFYEVYNTLGTGFLEKVYERSLMIELELGGMQAKAQVPIAVSYKGKIVGNYSADIVVNDVVVLELKAAEVIAAEYEYQLINYLRATEYEVGLVLNFGPKPQIRRKIYTNDRKKDLNS